MQFASDISQESKISNRKLKNLFFKTWHMKGFLLELMGYRFFCNSSYYRDG